MHCMWATESMAGFPEEMNGEVIRNIEEQKIALGRVEDLA